MMEFLQVAVVRFETENSALRKADWLVMGGDRRNPINFSIAIAREEKQLAAGVTIVTLAGRCYRDRHLAIRSLYERSHVGHPLIIRRVDDFAAASRPIHGNKLAFIWFNLG